MDAWQRAVFLAHTKHRLPNGYHRLDRLARDTLAVGALFFCFVGY